MIGVTQYILLCSIAMIFYPGGTEVNPNTPGYSFLLNQMSDLGRTESISGEKNHISMILFMITVIFVNVTFSPFYFAMLGFFSEKRVFCFLAAISELISAIFGITIAFFPTDQFPTAHLSVTLMFSIFFAIALCLIVIPIISNNSYPNRYGYVIMLYTVILAYYIMMVSTGVNPSTEEGLLILATGQKIVIYSGFLCIFILAYGAYTRYNKISIGESIQKMY
jgi:hypothetical protein